MPRKAAPRVRSDGEVTGGATGATGQPNGAPRAAVTAAQAAGGAGAPMRYGEATDLAGAAAATPQTPPPPGVDPNAHAAASAPWQHGLPPMQGPTERPWEPVTAGAPLDASMTHPMALPSGDSGDQSIASILQQAAQSTNSSSLRALADRAASTSGGVL